MVASRSFPRTSSKRRRGRIYTDMHHNDPITTGCTISTIGQDLRDQKKQNRKCVTGSQRRHAGHGGRNVGIASRACYYKQIHTRFT